MNSAPSTVNGDDASSSDFPSVSMIGEYTSAQKEKAGKGRDSLSSVTTANDFNESSGYSTPATSAVTTPAIGSKPPTTRRGRRSAAMASVESSTLAVNAVARAAALRNSRFALNSAGNKRKRIPSSDEEEDADVDNTPDAQLARALQEQEDASAHEMAGSDGGSSLRRTPRKVQKILPKTDFASDFSDSDIEMTNFSPKLAKRPKIELGASGSNTVKFGSAKKSKFVADSDEDSDDFVEIDDSEDDLAEDSDAPIAMSSARSRAKQEPKKYKISLETTSSRNNSRPVPKASGRISKSVPKLKREDTKASASSSGLTDIGTPAITDSEFDSELSLDSDDLDSDIDTDDGPLAQIGTMPRAPRMSMAAARRRVNNLEERQSRRGRMERLRLEAHHPELHTMWKDLEDIPKIGDVKIEQPKNISRELKPFQLEGVAWMKAMEQTEWGGGLLGDEMGMGKTIQAVSLIMSDFPQPQPSLVLIPPVALMQWQQEIADYTDGTLKTFVFHGTNVQTKGVTVKELKKYDVILMSYNSLESMYRKQEKGFKRKNGIHKEKSVIHQIRFHRVILDEAHNIKVSSFIARRWLGTNERHCSNVLPDLPRPVSR
jgi:DNA repair protein RAD16